MRAIMCVVPPPLVNQPKLGARMQINTNTTTRDYAVILISTLQIVFTYTGDNLRIVVAKPMLAIRNIMNCIMYIEIN
jgi:hypothetical protein